MSNASFPARSPRRAPDDVRAPALAPDVEARHAAGAVNVAVVGGGVGGLTMAYRLASRGARVSLFEASDRFGGLGTYFEHEGHPFERFYHVILPTDDALLGLLEDLDMAEDVYWKVTTLGFVFRNRLYDLVGAMDLLRFDAVPFVDRLRLGITALWATHVARPGALDDVTAAEWLRGLSGRTAFERLWRPLLEAKFGDAYDRIPALWYWSHFDREKRSREEVRGYVRGGYGAVARRLVRAAGDAGAVLNTGTPVERVMLSPDPSKSGSPPGVRLRIDGTDRDFDSVVFCLPLAEVTRLSDPDTLGPHLRALPADLDHQGVLNVLLMLRRPLTRHYWIPVVDSGVPFRGIVETTKVLEADDAAGRHLVYLLNYLHRDSAEFARSDEDVARDYTDGLLRLFPDLARDDIRSTHVFRTPYVEPIWTPGYLEKMPPDELVPGRVYISTTAQAYPRVTSWNSAVELANRVADRVPT